MLAAASLCFLVKVLHVLTADPQPSLALPLASRPPVLLFLLDDLLSRLGSTEDL